MFLTTNNKKWRLEDWLFFFALLLQHSGNFEILPLNLVQIIILAMLVVILARKFLKSDDVRIPKNYFLLMLYIIFFTFIHYFDFDTVKTTIYLGLEILTIIIYVTDQKDYTKLLNIVISAAVVMSIYGIIQEIAYLLGIPQIYDITLYGFTTNGAYETKMGLLRAMSFNAEPSQAAGLLSIGLIALLYKYRNKKLNLKQICQLIFMIVYGVLTLSLVVWVCLAAVFVVTVFVINKSFYSKLKWLILILFGVLLILVISPDLVYMTIGRLNQFTMMDYEDGTSGLSALALVSNLRVAIEKLKDGYIFGTGLDSHRLYYDVYIDKIYTKIYMKLNYEDAASLYTRILSEFGIVGLGIFLVQMIKVYFSSKRNNRLLIQIFVLTLLVIIIRDGAYTGVTTVLLYVIVIFDNKRKFYLKE